MYLYIVGKTFQSGSGNKIKVYIAILPVGDRTEPVDVTVAAGADLDKASFTQTITLGAAAAKGATTLTVTALPQDLPSGSKIVFKKGTADEQIVTLTASATAAATSLTVAPLTNSLATALTAKVSAIALTVSALSGALARGTRLLFEGTNRVYIAEDAIASATTVLLDYMDADITSGDEAVYTAKLRLLGGTSTGLNLNPNRTGVTVFEDVGGFEDGVVTNGTWEMPWSANFITDDEGYERAKFAARRSPVDNREVYVWKENPIPVGKITGEIDKGAALITGLSESFPSDGILTTSFTFSGQGAPGNERAA